MWYIYIYIYKQMKVWLSSWLRLLVCVWGGCKVGKMWTQGREKNIATIAK
jgi:hypothetical protein